MEHTKVHVWHDREGRILAVGRPPSSEGKGRTAVPVPLEGQFIIEADILASEAAKLHETHLVDVEAKALKQRPE